MDDDRAERQERWPLGEPGGGPTGPTRLPNFDRPAVHRRPDYAWYGEDDGPPRSSAGTQFRETGVRSTRRATTWTAAALIATVAATTGYLAHAIPVSGTAGSSTSAGTGQAGAGHTGKSGAVTSGAPAVGGPVVTSGGSGVTAGSGGGDN
jgi:hypothetical protein